jgi:hypothetical protein
MTGLQVESYIHFEEINHSSDYYKDGQKFKVSKVCREEGWFEILGTENPYAKKVKWGLAKDDVTPKDIFRMTNEGPSSRAVIAKYCIQDCNLVHYLFNKVDVLTDLVEMSKLCSVPMSFLIFRGQGIKLTSYVAKKCREKGVLMPVINKGSKDDGYEGAIVLNPKCGLYLDDPVCVGDFASLYPSSMLSENLCPSSKVWTKIYDLAGNLVLETGEKDYNKKLETFKVNTPNCPASIDDLNPGLTTPTNELKNNPNRNIPICSTVCIDKTNINNNHINTKFSNSYNMFCYQHSITTIIIDMFLQQTTCISGCLLLPSMPITQ